MPGKANPMTDADLSHLDCEAKLYHLDPPLHSTVWGEQDVEYVIVYSTFFPVTGHVTYVLASDENGHLMSPLELEGSNDVSPDHAEALRRAGYEVA